MATHLSDMIIPEVFGNYVLNTTLKTNRFVLSGILTPDPDLGPRLLDAGTKITVPFINDLSGDPDNWTDTDDIQVNQLTSGKQLGLKFYQTKAFGYTSLSQMISGAPTQATIGNRFGNFWIRADEKMLLAVLNGVMGVSKVKNTKFYDATVKTPTDAAFSAKGFIAAISLMGDLQDTSFGAIAVNSATYSMMKMQNLIETIQPQNGALPFEAYNGLRIVLDDDIPVDLSNKQKPTTTSYIFAPGAVRYSSILASTETKYDPTKDGGTDVIIQKRVGTIHVAGTSVKPSFEPAKGAYPTIEELGKSSTWEVVDGIDPRTIGVVAYKAELDPALVPGAEVATGGTGA
ncbi:replication protein [Ligilactobacillus faecis]|uniref:replication protein n=1 Tax=Ligilactobacillus faecis TaxID=762833 RepID=UPI0024694CEA|nr:replication protein [Ligilactobacillus faecis]WGN89157.1 replication protein [Ligilactobacillus faecis]